MVTMRPPWPNFRIAGYSRIDVPHRADHSIRAGLIVESVDPKSKEGIFTPAIDISKLTLGFVIGRVEGVGELKRSSHTTEEYLRIKTLYNEMEDAMYKSPSNKHLRIFNGFAAYRTAGFAWIYHGHLSHGG